MREVVLGIGIIALACTYLLLTYHLPVEDIGDPIGPQLFPYLIGLGLAFSGVLVIVEAAAKPAGGLLEQPEAADADTQPGNEPPGGVVARPLAVISVLAWMGAYFLMFEWLGFAISCSIFLLGFLAFFNRDRWLTNVIVALVFSFGIYILFTQFLGVKLAPGQLPY